MAIKSSQDTAIKSLVVPLILIVGFSILAGASAGFGFGAFVAFGIAMSILFVATKVILTSTFSDLDIEDVDLNAQSKAKNWIPETSINNSGSSKNSKNDGHFVISGFQYVSGGYYWAKPMVHWRSQNEPEGTDHQAYVNGEEINENQSGYYSTCLAHKSESKICNWLSNGVRLGKAAGADLANLSRATIIDKNNSNAQLNEGDIIWFGAEVTAGIDRVAEEHFIYSKKSNYQAGYFTQGTTLIENGQRSKIKAHLVTFGPIDKVSYEMSQYIKVANSAFWSMVISVSVGIVLTALTPIFLYVTEPEDPGDKIIGISYQVLHGEEYISSLQRNGIILSILDGLYLAGSALAEREMYLAALEEFYFQELKGADTNVSENETPALLISLMNSKFDRKTLLYQLFYDIQNYIDCEIDYENTKHLIILVDKILYALHKIISENVESAK